MNLRPLIAATSLLGTLFASAPSAAAGPTLALRISGFRSGDGQALIVVYRGEDGFPKQADKAWKKLAVKVAGGRASVDLGEVPAGDYAVVIVHDENGNNQLDTSWIGIPQEGIGTSNNAKGTLGPPKYKDAAFSFSGSALSQELRMKYR